jgi:hypothetical protein
MASRYERNKRIGDAIKKSIGHCENCRKEPKETSDLIFHHSKGEKLRAVTSCYSISRKQTLEEIAKCEVWCEECHKKHYEEKPVQLTIPKI